MRGLTDEEAAIVDMASSGYHHGDARDVATVEALYRRGCLFVSRQVAVDTFELGASRLGLDLLRWHRVAREGSAA